MLSQSFREIIHITTSPTTANTTNVPRKPATIWCRNHHGRQPSWTATSEASGARDVALPRDSAVSGGLSKYGCSSSASRLPWLARVRGDVVLVVPVYIVVRGVAKGSPPLLLDDGNWPRCSVWYPGLRGLRGLLRSGGLRGLRRPWGLLVL